MKQWQLYKSGLDDHVNLFLFKYYNSLDYSQQLEKHISSKDRTLLWLTR